MAHSVCKLLFLGPAASGKDWLVNKLIYPDSNLKDVYDPTIGARYAMFNNRQEKIKFQFWNAAGQERFRSLLPLYIKDTHIFVLCVDLSSELNQDEIKEMMTAIRRTENHQNTPVVLVWTKSDAKRVVTDDEINALNNNENYKFAKVLTVSSKKNLGIDDLWNTLITINKSLAESKAPEVMDIDQLLAKLDKTSITYEKVKLLKEAIKDLSIEKQKLIGTGILTLFDKLLGLPDVADRTKAINDYEKEATGHLGGSYPKIVAAIIGVTTTILVTVLAAAVGFGIGFLAGAWTGPGAFISGVLAGSAAAYAVVGVSPLIGVGLGFFGGYAKYNSAMNQNAPIYDVVEAVRAESCGLK